MIYNNKILISHRGNLFGPNREQENKPEYIEECLSLNYDCEIDLRIIDRKIFLGHDYPEYEIDISWLKNRNNNLWIHCKNIDAIVFLQKYFNYFHYFWHENDLLTLTSKNYIWAFPGKQPIENSISVMPELYNDITIECVGICSDFIGEYK